MREKERALEERCVGAGGEAKMEKEQRRRGEGEMKNAEQEGMCVCKCCSNLLSPAPYDQSLSAAYKTHTAGSSLNTNTDMNTYSISLFSNGECMCVCT